MSYSRRGGAEVLVVILAMIMVVGILGGVRSCTIIDPGETGVQVTFGKVSEAPLREGMTMINPFSSVVRYDIRQQSHKEDDVTVPSRDQLTSTLDVSVQYTLNPALTPKLLQEIGDIDRIIAIAMQPKIRSALRESTKTIATAEEYMTNETQTTLQTYIEKELMTLKPMGIVVSEVLLRDIKLPKVISDAVQMKKEREQKAIMQEAELQRFTVEQQQKVAQASAEKSASEQAALRMRIEADAEAYKIKVLNEAAASSPVYVQLKALEALGEISKNPSHKIFFIDGKGQYPVPLLHMGEGAESLKK